MSPSKERKKRETKRRRKKGEKKRESLSRARALSLSPPALFLLFSHTQERYHLRTMCTSCDNDNAQGQGSEYTDRGVDTHPHPQTLKTSEIRHDTLRDVHIVLN